MDIAVIKSAQNNGSWNGSNGIMYVQEIELEDGRVGQVNAKKPGRWMVGDKVEVKGYQQTHRGNKMQLGLAINVTTQDVRQGETGQAQGFRFPDDRQEQINASWAIGQAIAMGYNDGEAIKDAARKLLVYRETIIAELKANKKAIEKLDAEIAAAPEAENNEASPF